MLRVFYFLEIYLEPGSKDYEVFRIFIPSLIPDELNHGLIWMSSISTVPTYS